MHAVEDLRLKLCPWCIADGSAAERFDATFNDTPWRVPEEVPEDVTDMILRRTPGFVGWQEARWLHHCGDAAEFHGLVGAPELAVLPDALACLRSESEEYGWPSDQIEWYLSALSKDGQPTGYLFRCRQCRTHLAYSDFT